MSEGNAFVESDRRILAAVYDCTDSVPCDVCGSTTSDHNRHRHNHDIPETVVISGISRPVPFTSGPVYTAVATTEDMGDGGERTKSDSAMTTSAIGKKELASVIILFCVNLLNYMDRFTVAGVLPEVKSFYQIEDGEAGLLQTSFVCSFMIFAPTFGYLGDRFNRKIIMAVGITFWSATTLIGSFVPEGYFWWFLILRGLVGIGEASYCTIAPTLIADMYSGQMRSRMLAFFYFAIPVGSGMGYIVGSNVAKAADSWQWSLRVTPPLGVVCVILLLFILNEPPRGESEGGHHLSPTSWKEDMISLMKNSSFLWSTLGFTGVAFVAGALSWWGPTFLYRSVMAQHKEADLADISLVFGIITVIAGVVGVAAGSLTAQYLKQKSMTADPLVCAFGMVMSTPFLYFGAIVSKYNTPAAYALIFFGETFLCLNWALVADILLYVVIPTRRSSAEAFQILFSHAFGDAGSPYIIGLLTDAIGKGKAPTTVESFHSLQYALFVTCFVSVIGGLCFVVCSWYIVDDKKAADDAIRGVIDQTDSDSTCSQLEQRFT